MQNPEIYFKMSPLMTSLFNGNFIYANFLLDLGVDLEACDSNGKNVLLHATEANHIANYRDPETIKSFDLKEKLKSLFGESQTIAEDELQTFKRIFALKDWFRSMDAIQIDQLLIILHKEKRYIFDFVVDQWQHHPDYDKKIDLLIKLPKEHKGLFCEIADRWRGSMEIKLEESIIEKFIEMGFFSKPEIKSTEEYSAEKDLKPEAQASAAVGRTEVAKKEGMHTAKRPNPEIAVKSKVGKAKKIRDMSKVI